LAVVGTIAGRPSLVARLLTNMDLLLLHPARFGNNLGNKISYGISRLPRQPTSSHLVASTSSIVQLRLHFCVAHHMVSPAPTNGLPVGRGKENQGAVAES